jgi:hypothetical protein
MGFGGLQAMGMTDQEKKEKRNAYQKAWRKANLEKAKASEKAWRDANREKETTRAKAWRNNNREKVNDSVKKWKKANLEKVKALEKSWRDANPESLRVNFNKKRALSFNKLHPDHDIKKERSLYILAKNCEAIFNEPFDVDHILPYGCGGWHHHDNLQVIPARINRQKKDNPDFQSNWPNFKTWRDLPEFLLSEKNF